MTSSHTVTYEFPRADRVSALVGRIPRVTRLLALAHRLDARIRSGEIRNWAEAARLLGITRARMTQIARLLLLSPPIQTEILGLPLVAEGDDPITERDLRQAVTRPDWTEQQEEWHLLHLYSKRPAPAADGLRAPASSARDRTGPPLTS